MPQIVPAKDPRSRLSPGPYPSMIIHMLDRLSPVADTHGCHACRSASVQPFPFMHRTPQDGSHQGQSPIVIDRLELIRSIADGPTNMVEVVVEPEGIFFRFVDVEIED